MIGFLAAADVHTIHGDGLYNYWLIVILMMTGLYLVLARGNMVKTIIGLNIFQVSVIMFYVSMGKVEYGTAPILVGDDAPEAPAGHHDDGQDGHDDGHEGHDDGDDGHHKDGHGMMQPSPDGEIALASMDRLMAAATKDGHKPKISRAKLSPPPTHGKSALYSNPLPHVLMLTAIVVGVATTALALSLVVRINEYTGTIEEDEIEAMEGLA